MKSTKYMESKIYLRRSILLILCIVVAITTYAQSAQKPYPAAKRGRIIQMNSNAATKENLAADAKAQAADKRDANKKKDNKKKNDRKVAKTKSVASSDHYIALKANVPFAAVAIQNLALEVQCHEHISVDFPVMWSISDLDPKHAVRTFALQPEGRWWTGTVGKGHFFGLHAHVAWFNLKWEEDRYQSQKRPLMGAGISYGYKLPISEHWGAEFNIGAGYANMKYNTYYNIENGAKIDTRIRNYWGITRLGLSLVYRF